MAPETSDEAGPSEARTLLRGGEHFQHGPGGASVLDFWRFAMGDLRTNNVRGYLAEFLVAKAVGSSSSRVEWDAWDVTAPDGTRIEVKTSGFVQAWAQTAPSSPAFVVRPAATWDSASGRWSGTRSYNADVYVFCLHTVRVPADYDVLDVSQWQFYVCAHEQLEARLGPAGGRLSLNALDDLTGGRSVGYDELAFHIAELSPRNG